ncbi:hypothetical protein [Yeosuana marina]|uniref:hypothetical protein n=1 Tax=Yeosuana marina TaxID=1565536 RepID=UPI00141EBC1C|nr:hypothetical protein [Yeosuana marina]|tara:strand:+ start:11115 stop:11495 length:381 start_codon:yes stop_codon:yes gene_type:complete
MQTKVLYLSDLRFNLDIWRSELKFHSNEMDLFEEKLEEIARREFGPQALKELEMFQNKIMIERDVISKLLHRIRSKKTKLERPNAMDNVDAKFQDAQHTLREDMQTYIKLHYELKEAMMDYFLEWL